jgi:hypothetical protein
MSVTIEAAARVLLVGGLANLVFSFALGWLLSVHRRKDAIEPHHWLLVAHTVAMQEGLFLLGLSYAMNFAQLPGSVAITSAWLLVAASAFQDMSGVVNWWRGTKDQFAEKSAGWVLASINAVLNTGGLLIVAGGVARALW